MYVPYWQSSMYLCIYVSMYVSMYVYLCMYMYSMTVSVVSVQYNCPLLATSCPSFSVCFPCSSPIPG